MFRPIYSSACGYSFQGHPINETRYIQAAFEQLFYDYQVDIVFNGHVHSYERNYAIYNDTKIMGNNGSPYDNPKAPVYIIPGAPGCEEGFESCWDPKQPQWSAFRLTQEYGFGQLTVVDDVKSKQHQLKWQWVRSSDGKVLDEFVLTKPIN